MENCEKRQKLVDKLWRMHLVSALSYATLFKFLIDTVTEEQIQKIIEKYKELGY